MTVVAPDSYQILLSRLHADEREAEKEYFKLRDRLSAQFAWDGCPDSDADDLVDKVIDRLATRIIRGDTEGEEIRDIKAYAGKIRRFVWREFIRTRRWREFLRERKRRQDDGDDSPDIPFEDNSLEKIFDESDVRLRCLRKCITEKITDKRDKRIILGYYDLEDEDKLHAARKHLADELGITMNFLRVRATRLRQRLEICLNDCFQRLGVTKNGQTATK